MSKLDRKGRISGKLYLCEEWRNHATLREDKEEDQVRWASFGMQTSFLT